MTGPPHNPGVGDGSEVGPEAGSGPAVPRWAVVLGIIVAIALVGLMVLAHLSSAIGSGSH